MTFYLFHLSASFTQSGNDVFHNSKKGYPCLQMTKVTIFCLTRTFSGGFYSFIPLLETESNRQADIISLLGGGVEVARRVHNAILIHSVEDIV